MRNKIIKRFLENTSGNVAVIFSLVAVPLVVLIGGGIDIQRVSASKVKLQSAVEASALAAASFKNSGTVTEEFVKEYIQANLSDANQLLNVNVNIDNSTITLNKREIVVSSTATVPSYFLQLVGINDSEIKATSTAVESRGSIEYSMVLDISSSMSGAKLANLKEAANDFVDTVLGDEQVDTTSINLVPFGGTVNLGSAVFNDHVVKGNNIITNPSSNAYKKDVNVPNHRFRFTDGDNCVELHKSDYDLDLIPQNSRPQVPHFWKFVYFNPWCPKSTSAAVWNSNDADVLKAKVNGLTLSDGTGMNHGALWGAKALSPSYRGKLGGDFPERPVDFEDTETTKVIIIMTDGSITAQSRPKDYKAYSVHTDRFYGSKARKSGQNNGKKGNKKNQQTILKNGNNSAISSDSNAIGNFKKTCEDLKAKGVNIYTVGFQIDKDSNQEELLQYCATNPANYYLVESLDIKQAFRSIISSVNKLRVSG